MFSNFLKLLHAIPLSVHLWSNTTGHDTNQVPSTSICLFLADLVIFELTFSRWCTWKDGLIFNSLRPPDLSPAVIFLSLWWRFCLKNNFGGECLRECLIFKMLLSHRFSEVPKKAPKLPKINLSFSIEPYTSGNLVDV